MSRPSADLQQYLAAIGRLAPIDLGEEPAELTGEVATVRRDLTGTLPGDGVASPRPSPADLDREGADLSASLRWVRRANGRFTIALVALAVVAFAGAFYVALASRGPTGTAAAAGSGAVVALAAISAGLHRLWREKSMMDLLIAVIEASSRERAADLIEAVYWTAFAPRKGTGSG